MSRPPLLLLLVCVCLGLTAVACGETDRTLKVTGLEPERGEVNGDTYVVIKGNGFLANKPKVDVFFGTVQGGYRKATVVRFETDNRLIVRSPGGKPGEVADVLVMFEPGGQKRIEKAFTYFVRGADATVDDLNIKKDPSK